MKDFPSNKLQQTVRVVGKGESAYGSTQSIRLWLSSLLNSPIWARRRWLHLFGWPGLLGVALLAICSALFVTAIRPAQIRLAVAQQSAVSIQEQVQRAANGLNQNRLAPVEQLTEFYRVFPSDKNLLPWVEKVFTVAQKQGIRLDKGEYKVTHDRIGKLVRFQLTLPVKAGYPQIRKYLDSLRVEIPIIAIENLQFERQKVDDPVVDAKIKLAIYLVQEP